MKPIHKLIYTLIASLTLLLAGCGGSSNTLSEADQAKMQRAETQTAALKTAYDAAVAALETLEDDTSDATRAEVDDAQAKLDALKTAITAAMDVSDEVKARYPADALETELTETEKLAGFGLALERLRMAASKAIEEAGKAIEEAGEAIEGAETAIEDLAGIIPFQTGAGNHRVEQDVEKARMDYEQAKRDYEAAKKKNEMEREEADTIAKMNALSVAAEQAKKDAEAAKTAAETARMKAETDAETPNRTALRYADGTYSVGAMSINPTAIGKKKTTDTEGDKTMVTGLVEAITVKSRLIGTGDTASAPPVTAANNPSVEAGALIITLGNKYDSADDKARLRLITHYVSKTKKIGLRGGDLGEDDIELESTDDAPYGMYDHDDDAETPALELYKASDIDFHVLHTGSNVPTDDNFVSKDLPHYWIENLAPQDDAPDKVSEPTKAGNVFYYGDPDTIGDGVSWALRLTATKTETDGTVKYVYRKIRTYEGPAAPILDEAKDYKHINYGIWSTLSTSGNQSADLGIGFVRMLPEGIRTGSDMPSGSATYSGHYVANVMNAKSAKITEHLGTSTVTAKFDDNTVTVVLGIEDEDGYILNSDDTRLATLEGAISGDRFSGTKVTNIMALGGLTASADNGGDTPIYTGEFSGAFFGAKAAEAGGIFHFAHKDDNGAFNGAFGGVKQPAAE